MRLRGPQRGWAKVTLGLSLFFAVGVFVLFALSGSPWYGLAAAALVVGAGIWEWRHKRREEIHAERYEAEAEEARRKQ